MGAASEVPLACTRSEDSGPAAHILSSPGALGLGIASGGDIEWKMWLAV